jgi:hypothetical protein
MPRKQLKAVKVAATKHNAAQIERTRNLYYDQTNPQKQARRRGKLTAIKKPVRERKHTAEMLLFLDSELKGKKANTIFPETAYTGPKPKKPKKEHVFKEHEWPVIPAQMSNPQPPASVPDSRPYKKSLGGLDYKRRNKHKWLTSSPFKGFPGF